MDNKKRVRKSYVIKTGIALAALVLSVLLFIPMVSATGVNDGVDSADVNTAGDVTITFPGQADPLYLLVFHEAAADTYEEQECISVPDPTSGKIVYHAMDLAVVHGGETVTLYFAVIPQSDYEAYMDDGITKDISETGGDIEVKWTGSDSTEASFVLMKTDITRPVDVKDVTVVNTNAGAPNPYAVKAGDEITVTVSSNTATADIAGGTLEGEALSFTKTSGPDAAGYSTYAAVTSLPASSLGFNLTAPIIFAFTIDGVAIDQDSDIVNAGAPAGTILTRFAQLDENVLEATISVDTLMQDGYITAGAGNDITLTFGGIDRDFHFTVSELTVGTRTISDSVYTENGSNVTFSLDDTEGLSSGDKLDGIILKILDETGVEYTVTVDNGDEFTYHAPASSGIYELNITGCAEKTSTPPTRWIAFGGTKITYSLKAEDIYANAQYVLELKVDNGAAISIPMELVVDGQGIPVGDPDAGYTYEASLNLASLTDIIQDSIVTINRITREGSMQPYTLAAGLTGTEDIVFYAGLQFASIKYEVKHSARSNELAATGTDVVYAVQDDLVRFDIALSDAIKNNPEVSIAGLTGRSVSQSEFNAIALDETAFPDSDDLVFYVGATGKTLHGLFRIPNQTGLNAAREKAITLSLKAQYVGVSTVFEIDTGTAADIDAAADPVHTLRFWNPINPISFSFTMASNTKLESIDDPHITRGDQVQLSYTGVSADKVTEIVANDRTITPSAGNSGVTGSYSFNINGSENYTSGAKISVTLVVQNAFGKTYSIELPDTKAFTYMVRETPFEDELTVTFTNGDKHNDPAPGYYGVSEYSELAFSFETNEIYPAGYKVYLTYPQGEYEVELARVLEPAGSASAGYQYTGKVEISSLSGIQDFDEISISMKKDASNLTFTDNLGGASIKYFGAFTLLGLKVEYPAGNGAFEWEPTDEFAYIVDGDFIVVTMTFNHSLIATETDIQMHGITGVQVTKADMATFITSPSKYKVEMQLQYYFEDTVYPNDTVVCLYRVPDISSDKEYDQFRLPFQRETKDQKDYPDNVPITIKVNTVRMQVPGQPASINTGDYGPEKDGASEKFHQMLYWAPLDIWDPEVTLLNLGPDDTLPIDDLDAETYVIVRDGQEVRVTFTTKHRILVDKIATKFSPSGTSSSEAPAIALVYSEDQESQSKFVYTASFTIGDDPVSNMDDQTIIKFIWDITDVRDQKTGHIKYSDDTRWAIYYKPLDITEVTITTSNRKDETQFCKDEDTITVSFFANHFVILEGQTIIERPGVYEERRRRHREATEYSFTYEIQNGDLEDLDFVTFAFNGHDLAGDPFEFTDETPGVINRIKYYAPLEVTAEIESDNGRPEFARNGDTVTISTTTQHEAQTLDFRIGSREIGDNENYRENPTVSYRIPDEEEELYEGDIFFSVRLEDPAGNYELVSETAEEGEEGTKVTYDRSPPEIRILPGFNGFTNQDVGFTFMFNDMYLDMSTLSCILNDTERIRVRAGTDTTYSHQVDLAEEGEYVVSAVAIDMAGNEMEFAAICHLIIDKTVPVIKMDLGRNTFKAGFTLNNITGIIEDNLGNLVCTLTDNGGMHDWDLDTPIDEEGKKTIYTMVRDMAGNTSVPITYDIFIDGTAPQPLVINAGTQEVFAPEGKNFFVGSTANMAISLAPILMGDEGPDWFTTLQLVDSNGNIVHDFLADPVDVHEFSLRLPDFGTYTLLAAAVDDVGNETGPLMYLIEFREMYLLERLLQNTPLAGLAFIRYINDTMFFIICGAFVLLVAGVVVLVIRRRRKKKAYMAQEYVIIDNDEE